VEYALDVSLDILLTKIAPVSILTIIITLIQTAVSRLIKTVTAHNVLMDYSSKTVNATPIQSMGV